MVKRKSIIQTSLLQVSMNDMPAHFGCFEKVFSLVVNLQSTHTDTLLYMKP